MKPSFNWKPDKVKEIVETMKKGFYEMEKDLKDFHEWYQKILDEEKEERNCRNKQQQQPLNNNKQTDQNQDTTTMNQ